MEHEKRFRILHLNVHSINDDKLWYIPQFLIHYSRQNYYSTHTHTHNRQSSLKFHSSFYHLVTILFHSHKVEKNDPGDFLLVSSKPYFSHRQRWSESRKLKLASLPGRECTICEANKGVWRKSDGKAIISVWRKSSGKAVVHYIYTYIDNIRCIIRLHKYIQYVAPHETSKIIFI